MMILNFKFNGVLVEINAIKFSELGRWVAGLVTWATRLPITLRSTIVNSTEGSEKRKTFSKTTEIGLYNNEWIQ
jgi:hypothetical protein